MISKPNRDDIESFVRLLVYANVIDLKGMVATTSIHKKTSVAPESIRKQVRAYGKVQANLNKHETGFPNEKTLLALVKQGLPVYGMLGVGDGKDSEGSELIISVLEEKDERPLWVTAWGGVNTLAQALHKIQKTKSAAEAKRLLAKLRVYTISDQDDSGVWIRKNFPDLFYIVSPGDDYRTATWSAINSVIKGIKKRNHQQRLAGRTYSAKPRSARGGLPGCGLGHGRRYALVSVAYSQWAE